MGIEQRKTSLIQHSIPLTVVLSLICPVSGGLRAQELKKIAPASDRTMIHSKQSEVSRDSSLLKTSPVSIQNSASVAQNSELNAIAPPNPPSTLKSSSTQSTNYSWTNLKVGELSNKDVVPDSKNAVVLAQRMQNGQLIPASSTESAPGKTTQSTEEKTEKSPVRSDSTSDSPDLPVRLYIGPDFFYRNYSEKVPDRPDFKSNEFGTLYGLQANLDYVKGNNIYFGLGFRYGAGQTKYDGGLQDEFGRSLGPLKSKTNNQFLNIEGRLGYTFQTGKKKNLFLISPFLALGYHQWNRDISGADRVIPGLGPAPGPDGIENYSWGYVGPGFLSEYKISRKFRIGLNAKLMFMFGGNINFVSDQDRGNLGNDLQYEIELPLTYNIIEGSKNAIDLKLIPYYRSQNIAEGPLSVSQARSEPASNTSVWGATFGVQFRF